MRITPTARRLAPAWLALVYLGAAALPCPPAPLPAAHAQIDTSVSAPCPCGCSERAPGARSAQRLALAVPSREVGLEAPLALLAGAEPALCVPAPPRALPDPVPIAT